MLARRISGLMKKPHYKNQFSSAAQTAEEGKGKSLGRKIVQVLLLSVTGGIAVSALDDLAIYHSCSSKAMEKARQHLAVKDALGDPIARGPWYNASLAVAHKRHSVSCTIPVYGSRGTGVFHLRAVRNEDDKSWFSFLRPQDWDILIMEALVNVSKNEEKKQTFRITLSEDVPTPASNNCTACTRSQESQNSSGEEVKHTK